ncbi:Rsp5p-dependent ubiquitination, sorting of cargo proteins at the multivesicular body [Apophysomyces sp. BC1034]|nr:Rsp5p-dependent ubiquitination, sorting of cargo proteins at the multivesicular body [Apophysomyces sp. BC1015]KAG0190381.1 Rsp5p-dependent ubiquitination, sorting of cargo proteins at the multivesicular body [Apophysomyces sp. BC1034]
MPVNPSVIAERGLDAWTFVENEHIEDDEEESNVAVMDRTTLAFCHGKGCALTNLPLPINQEFVYWEVKVLELGSEDRLAIGLTTKPYPVWRLPGWHRHSVAYHSHNGAVYISDSFVGRPYGPPFKQGDVVGVGFLTRTSTVFFTRNGKNLGKASIGFKFPVYPAVGATGPCQVSVNLGQQEYLFSAANVREAALAPTQGVLPPPPAYGGHERDTLWFEPDGAHSANLAYSQPQPPSYS